MQKIIDEIKGNIATIDRQIIIKQTEQKCLMEQKTAYEDLIFHIERELEKSE